jgi:hypothetical protein
MDPDSVFIIDPRCLQKTNKKKSFSAYYFLKAPILLHHFSKTKSQKEVTKKRNQGFSYYFAS